MSKDLAIDSHNRLVNVVLPASIAVLERTLAIDPFEKFEDPETGAVKTVFNARLNGQALRAALGVVGAVVKLNDQALRRQAGGQLKALLTAIKAERPDLLKKAKTVEQAPATP